MRDGEALAQDMVRNVRGVSLVANLAGGASVFGILTFLDPDTSLNDPDTRISIAVFCVAMAGFIPIAVAIGYRLGAPVRTFLQEERAPTPRERAAVLRQPLRQSMLTGAGWVGAIAIFTPLQFVFDNPPIEALRVAFGITIGGLVTCLLVYLLLERAMRPAVALALAGAEPEESVALGVRTRLMLSWALASALPFLAIIVRLAIRDDSVNEVRPLVIAVAVTGVLVGGFALAVATRSISEPLTAVRQAMARVREGDLDARVEVYDSGEIGLLQAGFNRMADGLRERRHIEELFGRHVGTEVARAALDRGAVLGGEQREATALFIDLIGSTSLAQQRPAEEVVRILNAMFAAVARVIEREGGFVNKFEGDGALCVFGAPTDVADHAARALCAARQLRAELHELERNHPGLDAAIGVSSGVVVAGNVGAPHRFEFTIIGDPVNEAARLTELAKGQPGRILAGESAVEAAGAEADEWVKAGVFELRGRAEPTVAYEPISRAS